MPSTGFILAGEGARIFILDTANWFFPSRITASDDSPAICDMSDDKTSSFLRALKFGFAIPEGSVIDGVEVQVRCRAGAVDAVRDISLRLLSGGAEIGASQHTGQSWSDAFEELVFGGTSNLWGTEGLTASQVNSASFGASLIVANSRGDTDAQVDAVWINVHYSEPVDSPPTPDSPSDVDEDNIVDALSAEQRPGRQPIVVVEIDVDRCSLTYGVAPCTAEIGVTGERKCFNTLVTCQDVANYSPEPLTLRFAMATSSLPVGLTVIPSVQSVTTRPTRMNFGGQDPNYGALGRRAECEITFIDHPHRDLLVDPYLAERDYDPLERGTFWSKFLARNRYYQNRPLRIREGYSGQELEEMRTRHYVIDRIEGPDADGLVTLTAKDILKLADDERATAPRPSSGRLDDDIAADAISATLTPAGVGNEEYPAEGVVRIGDELLQFTRAGDTLTFAQRGVDATDAAEHSEGDTVQVTLAYNAATVPGVIQELLTVYGSVPSEFIPFADWSTDASEWASGSRVTRRITEPIGVNTLLSEITSQTNCTIWWDERDQQIKFMPLRPVVPTDEVTELDETRHILADALSISEDPEQRVSQVWTYFRQNNPTRGVADANNYLRLGVTIDEGAESAFQYGEQRIRTIFSPWLVNDGQAITLRGRLLSSYRDNLRTVIFELDAKDRELWTGDLVTISHRSIVDATGAPLVSNYLIIEAQEIEPGHRARYECRLYDFAGRYFFIMPNDTPTYSGATNEQRARGGWLANDEDGFNDGSAPYRLF